MTFHLLDSLCLIKKKIVVKGVFLWFSSHLAAGSYKDFLEILDGLGINVLFKCCARVSLELDNFVPVKCLSLPLVKRLINFMRSIVVTGKYKRLVPGTLLNNQSLIYPNFISRAFLLCPVRYLDLEMVEFKLHEVLIASISQVMMKSNGKGIVIVDNLAPNLSTETLYGDSLRLQQVLAAFLLISVTFTPSGGQLGVAASLNKDSIGESVQLGHLEFRYTYL